MHGFIPHPSTERALRWVPALQERALSSLHGAPGWEGDGGKKCLHWFWAVTEARERLALRGHEAEKAYQRSSAGS